MRQEHLARPIGISCQHIANYEHGRSRIPASRLHELAMLLDVPVSFFFGGVDLLPAYSTGDLPQTEIDSPAYRDIIEFIEACYAIEDREARRRLLGFAKMLAAGGEDQIG